MFHWIPLAGSSLWTILLLSVVFLIVLYFTTRRQPNLPPGPTAFPVIGNLHNVLSKDVLGKLRGLRQPYGDVYRLYLGHQLVIVLNGYDTIHEALVKKGALFAVRPPSPFSSLTKSTLKPVLVLADGLLWKQHRSFALKALQEFGFSSTAITVEKRINQEIDTFMETLTTMDASFDIKKLLTTSVSNIICSIIFGKPFAHEDPDFQHLLDIMEERVEALGAMTFALKAFPWLRALTYLPGDVLKAKRIAALGETARLFYGTMFDEGMASFDENSIACFTDLYIKEMRQKEKTHEECSLNESAFKGLCYDMFVAGTETTAATTRWVILFLLKNPEVQRKLQKDIDEVLGREKRPSLDDRSRLPYVEATIMETMRMSPAVLLSVPHSVPYDVEFQGHLIPQNTYVIVNLDSVLKDPNVWSEPGEFRPQRFLTADGDVHTPKEFIPFSIGRRSCIGESLARMELFLYTTRLLQKFTFRVPEGDPLPDSQGVFGVTYSPKPFRVSVERR